MRGPDPKDEDADIAATPRNTRPTKGVLELRLHFPEDVTVDEIIDSARTLKACMQKSTLHCHKITFLDMYTRDSIAVVRRAAGKWPIYVREHGRRLASDTGSASDSVAIATDTKIRSTQQDVDPGTIWQRQVAVSWGTLAVTLASMQALSLIVVRSLYLRFLLVFISLIVLDASGALIVIH